jgi:uncharacterized RDD family membrane protein YckC
MTQVPAGWYPDPYAQGRPARRYWDGTAWTAHVHLGPVPRPVPTTPDGAELAGFDKRAWAKIIDYLIVTAVGTALEAPFFVGWFRDYFNWIASMSDPAATPDPTTVFPTMLHFVFIAGLIGLIGGAVTVVYEVAMMRWKAATVGMRVMGIQVRLRETPGPLSWGTIARRVGAMYWPVAIIWIPFAGWLGGIYMWANYLWALGNPRKQALHDIAAGTNVVLADRAGG